jgi:hypothetical protein
MINLPIDHSTNFHFSAFSVVHKPETSIMSYGKNFKLLLGFRLSSGCTRPKKLSWAFSRFETLHHAYSKPGEVLFADKGITI